MGRLDVSGNLVKTMSRDDELRKMHEQQYTPPQRRGPRTVRVTGEGGGVVIHPDDVFLTRLPEHRPKPTRGRR